MPKAFPYQYGVPTNELAGEAMEADPKSASFTWPGSVSRMFPALISLRNMRMLTSHSEAHLMAGAKRLGASTTVTKQYHKGEHCTGTIKPTKHLLSAKSETGCG